MEVMEAIEKRYSVRNYADREIEPDKIEKTGLHLTHVDGQPTYEEGRYLLVCKILYSQAEKPELFLDAEVPGAVFPDKDYSVMYVGEIEAAYELEP